MQRITIEKLGPVSYFTTDVSQYVFLIGEQAVGKSTIAKSIYFCRNYKGILREALYDIYNTGMYKGVVIKQAKQFMQLLRSEVKAQFIEFFGYSWDLDRAMFLEYEFVPKQVWLSIDLESQQGYINLRNSRELTRRINKLLAEVMNLYRNKYVTQDTIGLNSKERIRTQTLISAKVNDIFEDYEETYYIPAGRSMLSLLSSGDVSSVRSSLDYITRQFVDIINSIRRYFNTGISSTEAIITMSSDRRYQKAAGLIIDILKADYYSTPDKDYIKIINRNGEDFSITLNYASSGQQESLWLMNLIYVLFIRQERSFVIIEEPEAHMYPVRQYKLLKYITYFANETGSNILITTHSPYCLTALNTLYVAGNKRLQSNSALRAKAEEILGGNYAVPSDKLQAYEVLSDGIQTLIDADEGELRTDKIDEVSKAILGEYLQIFELLETNENDKD